MENDRILKETFITQAGINPNNTNLIFGTSDSLPRGKFYAFVAQTEGVAFESIIENEIDNASNWNFVIPVGVMQFGDFGSNDGSLQTIISGGSVRFYGINQSFL